MYTGLKEIHRESLCIQVCRKIKIVYVYKPIGESGKSMYTDLKKFAERVYTSTYIQACRNIQRESMYTDLQEIPERVYVYRPIGKSGKSVLVCIQT
jgi:hypothetical protein